MSGARSRRSKSLWDNNKDDVDSSFHTSSPKRSNSEANNDVLMSDDFSHEPMLPNENMPYRGGGKDRERSRSPHRNRSRNREHGNERERRESYESGDMRNDSRASSHNRPGGSRFRDDRNKDSDSDVAYRNKDSDNHHRDRDRDRGNNGDNNNGMRGGTPCRFFMRGNCNRNRCKFSHDVPESEGYEERPRDNNRPHDYSSAPKSNRNLDDKNESWNDDLESFIANQESNQQPIHHSYGQDSTQNPTALNWAEKSPDMNGGGGKPLEASRNGENVAAESKEQEIPSSLPEKQILANALELLYSLPNSGSNDPIKSSVPDSQQHRNQIPVESKREEDEKKKDENEKKKKDENNSGKNDKVEEGGDEKAMRQFKIGLVEFVKEILKPTWKEGKMSREVYKTIVKKVVEKVSSSIQGVQIPRTQEKIDQYLAFSKSKITKLVEAYVGRLQKG